MSNWLEYALIGLIVGSVLTAVTFGADILNGLLRRRTAVDRLSSATSPEREASVMRLLVKQSADGEVHPAIAHLTALYGQAGGTTSPVALGAIGVTAATVGFIVVFNALGNAGLALGIGGVVGVSTPYMLLLFLQAKRRDAFVAQLPESMDVVVRSLRAGHPLSVAIGLVGRDMAEPAGIEFAAAAKEMSFGLDLESAVHNMANRVGAPEVNVLASAISIQQRTGGNLAEVLNRLATLLRDRARLRAKAKALSSEGRITGIFLSVLPVGMFVVLNLINPKYYGDVRDNPIVLPILFFTAVWMLIGIAIIQRMVNIKA